MPLIQFLEYLSAEDREQHEKIKAELHKREDEITKISKRFFEEDGSPKKQYTGIEEDSEESEEIIEELAESLAFLQDIHKNFIEPLTHLAGKSEDAYAEANKSNPGKIIQDARDFISAGNAKGELSVQRVSLLQEIRKSTNPKAKNPCIYSADLVIELAAEETITTMDPYLNALRLAFIEDRMKANETNPRLYSEVISSYLHAFFLKDPLSTYPLLNDDFSTEHTAAVPQAAEMIELLRKNHLELIKAYCSDTGCNLHELPRENAPGQEEPKEYYQELQEYISNPQHRKNRTRSKAEDVIQPSNMLAIISKSGYTNTIQILDKDETAEQAYMQLFNNVDTLSFRDGKIFFSGDIEEISGAAVQDLITKETITGLNLSDLQLFYGIIFKDFQDSGNKFVRDSYRVFLPQLQAVTHKSTARTDETAEAWIKTISSFHNMVGVIKGSSGRLSYYPVLLFNGYDAETNVISYSSPYFTHVIEKVHAASKRPDPAALKGNREYKYLPSHNFLCKASLLKERSEVAKQNVFIITNLILQAGNNTPHISVKTLIERNHLWSERYKTSKNKGQDLDRVLKATYSMLREHTILAETYQDIFLPSPVKKNNPQCFPSPSTIDKAVLTFSHKGKS